MSSSLTCATSRPAPSCSISGMHLRAAKQHAPTRPHPRGTDTPPGNVVTAPIASALDHARDVGRDVAERIGIAPDIR